MAKVDDLDLKLLSELKKDGSISVPVLAKKLEINSSVLYSRIKRLIKKKLIKKFTIEIDDAQLGYEVKASVGINRDPKLKDQIHAKLSDPFRYQYFLTSAQLIYHPPIGVISISANYVDQPGSKFGFLLNLGYLIFNKSRVSGNH